MESITNINKYLLIDNMRICKIIIKVFSTTVANIYFVKEINRGLCLISANITY